MRLILDTLGSTSAATCASPFQKTLRLIPKKLRVGLGCRRGVCASAITSAIRHVLRRTGWTFAPSRAFFRSILKKTNRGFCRPAGKTAGRLRLSCADLAGRAGRIYGVKLRRVYHRCGQRLRAGGHGGRGAAARFKNCDGRRDHRRRAGALGGTLWVRFCCGHRPR